MIPEIRCITFLPRFKTISSPKKSYHEKVNTSPVFEFSRIHLEEGNEMIHDFLSHSSKNIQSWVIYPHQADYCDFCAKVKRKYRDINRPSTVSARVRVPRQTTFSKIRVRTSPCKPSWCSKEVFKVLQWDEGERLDRDSSRKTEQTLMIMLRNWRICSINSCLFRAQTIGWANWYRTRGVVLSQAPLTTCICKKVSYDLLGTVDHTNDSGFVYLFSELKEYWPYVFYTIWKVAGKFRMG